MHIPYIVVCSINRNYNFEINAGSHTREIRLQTYSRIYISRNMRGRDMMLSSAMRDHRKQEFPGENAGAGASPMYF